MTTDLKSAAQTVSVRTSESDPLRIDVVEYGNRLIGLTMCPGRIGRSMTGPDWARSFEADMALVHEWKPDEIICVFREIEDESRNMHWKQDQIGRIGWTLPSIHQITLVKLGLDGLPKNTATLDRALQSHRKSGKRILVISERGLEGAGLVAGFMLRRLGAKPDEAISLVNTARPDAILCAYQRDFIQKTCGAEVPKAVPARELQPPGIIAAKANARHIQMVGGYTRSKSLEIWAEASGWRNWSTMAAAFSGPGLPYPQHNASAAATHKALGLCGQDPEDVCEALDMLCFSGPDNGQNDMWANRSRSWLRACIYGLFDLHRRHGVQVGADSLRHCLHLEGELGFNMLVRAYHIGRLDGPGKPVVTAMTDTLPGYDIVRALRGESQMEKTTEQAGFMALHFSKVYGGITDGDTPLPAQH